MKGKFSLNFFSTKEQKTDESLVSASKEEFSKKYSKKAAESLRNYIEQETRDVLDEIHGDYVYEDDSSDNETYSAGPSF